MKKSIKLILLIVFMIVLTGCEEPTKNNESYKQLFDQLYEQNFEYAEKYINEVVPDDKYRYVIYDCSKGGREEMPYAILDRKAMDNEGIARVILSFKTDSSGMKYSRIRIIEFESMEYAKKMMAKNEIENIEYARYQNIVYDLDYFGSLFVHGEIYIKDGFYCDKDSEILYFPEKETLKLEELKIPDSYKYILPNAFNSHDPIYISQITCGENLRSIGAYAFQEVKELEYFESNKNLINIRKKAFFDSPKLKTVILNEGLEYIDDMAFDECPSLEYVVIPSSVKDIGKEAFTSGILYIEAKTKPVEWDDNFAGKDVIIYWGNEWEYNEDGIPVPIK